MSSLPAKLDSVKIAQGAFICKDCEIIGDVMIGTGTVIHPKVKIIAEDGPIIIGEHNLIEEQVVIINKFSEEDKANLSGPQTMKIGTFNVFEVGSYNEALKIGDHNILECKSHVGRLTQLSKGCVIGPKCIVTQCGEIPENTVIFSSDCHRRLQIDKPTPQSPQLDFLIKILPNYHHFKKPTK